MFNPVCAITEIILEYLTGAEIEVFTHKNPLAYPKTTKLGAFEPRWAACLAQFKLKIHYRSKKLNRHANTLSLFLVEHPVKDVDSKREDIEVAPVLPAPTASCAIE